MFKKTCSSCGKNSYSSNSSLKWICPYCNQDLSMVEAEIAEVTPEKTELKESTKTKSIG